MAKGQELSPTQMHDVPPEAESDKNHVVNTVKGRGILRLQVSFLMVGKDIGPVLGGVRFNGDSTICVLFFAGEGGDF